MPAPVVGADAVRPNVLRTAVAPNTLGGLTQAVPSHAGRSTTSLVLAFTAIGATLLAFRAIIGR